MVEGEIEQHGFILVPASPLAVGFTEEQLVLLSDEAAGATLRVYYRDLVAMGVEGGAKALLARSREARTEGTGHPR